jgi:hypothetical protein
LAKRAQPSIAAGSADHAPARPNIDLQKHAIPASLQQPLIPFLGLDEDSRKKQADYRRKGEKKREKMRQTVNPQERLLERGVERKAGRKRKTTQLKKKAATAEKRI